ncbi:MAG: hypothetical protein ACO3YA_03010 [Candidatus Nanopelagicaceae bacterium]
MTMLRGVLIAPPGSHLSGPLIAGMHEKGLSLDLVPFQGDTDTGQFDLIIVIIAADRGISATEIEAFNRLRERQIPALLLVTSLLPHDGITLADDRWDFDDVTMLISRTLEKPVTPFLVLHDDAGLPIALYDLKSERVLNYSTGTAVEEESDQELKEIVKEFKIEFDDEDFTEDDFTTGLRVVAIPFIPERGIGIDQSVRLLTMLQRAHS